jgi:hypothetical protein
MKQWLRLLPNVEKVQALNCETMQHRFFEGLHQTFEPLIWHKPTNPCTQEWYFIEWMMASGTPSTR